MGKFNKELVQAGIMLAGEGLKPSSEGVRVRFSGADRTVIDGPFAETKELVAGYWLWQVKSMAEAIEWVKRCPNPMQEDSDIEIRALFQMEDFAANDPTGELAAAEERLVAEIEKYAIDPPRIERIPERLIAGVNESYTPQTRQNIPAQWCRFAPQIGSVPGEVAGNSYGVCWNTNPECGFDYLTGVEVTSAERLPEGFQTVAIPAGRYLVFTHSKHVSKLAEAIDAIWSKWLPNSQYQTAESPCFERYTAEFDPNAGTGGMEVWVPLKS
jgi:predicted transcriptional regulator YdeE